MTKIEDVEIINYILKFERSEQNRPWDALLVKLANTFMKSNITRAEALGSKKEVYKSINFARHDNKREKTKEKGQSI